MLRIVIDGQPVPWARAMGGRNVAHFTPAKVRSYQGVIRFYAQQAMNGAALIEGPIALAVRAYMPVPQSWSKKKRAAALAGEVRPTGKPDLSNLIKAPEDALKSVVWRDDAQVVSYDGSGKWYADKPRIEIEIKGLSE